VRNRRVGELLIDVTMRSYCVRPLTSAIAASFASARSSCTATNHRISNHARLQTLTGPLPPKNKTKNKKQKTHTFELTTLPTQLRPAAIFQQRDLRAATSVLQVPPSALAMWATPHCSSRPARCGPDRALLHRFTCVVRSSDFACCSTVFRVVSLWLG
jgi:hypothetical protein